MIALLYWYGSLQHVLIDIAFKMTMIPLNASVKYSTGADISAVVPQCTLFLNKGMWAGLEKYILYFS